MSISMWKTFTLKLEMCMQNLEKFDLALHQLIIFIIIKGRVHKIQLTSYISRLFQNELKTDLAAVSECNMSDHPSGAAEAFLKLGAEEELVFELVLEGNDYRIKEGEGEKGRHKNEHLW